MNDIKMFRKSLVAKVERIEELEEKIGIDISHLSIIAEPDSPFVDLNFELRPKNGNTFEDTFCIHYAFYEEDGTIIKKNMMIIDHESFYKFAIISEQTSLENDACDIARILLYPSKSYV